MKKIILYTLLLFAPVFLWGQTTTTSFNLRCEDCETEGDEDGDGFADCEDLDCYINNLLLSRETKSRSRNDGCFDDLSDELSCLMTDRKLLEGMDLSTNQGIMYCSINARINLTISQKECLIDNEKRLQAVSDFLDKYRDSNTIGMGSEKDIADAIAKKFISLDCETSENIFDIIVDDEDPPGCTGCSVGQAGIVTLDHIRAREKLKCAIDLLKEYNGPNTGSPNIDNALIKNMGNASKAVGQGTRLILKLVELFSGGTEYALQSNGTGICGATASAWSFPAIHFTDVRLCDPVYFNRPDVERSATLIHEWMHLYYIAGDIAYDHESEFNELGPVLHSLNADSFSELVKELCP